MFNSIDFEKFLNLFVFDKWDPLLFSTSLFMFLFFILLIFYRIVVNKKTARISLLIVFSFFFYYKVSGLFFFILIFSTVINYFAAVWIAGAGSQLRKRFLFISAVVVNISVLGYFKYTNFFVQIINNLKLSHLDPLDILLPIGISFYTFKALSYIIDVYWDTLKPEKNFLDFCLYITFFANILAGPIDRASEFLPQTKRDVFLTKEQLGLAVYLIISGLFKKAVIADYISINFVSRVFDSPLRFTGVENLIGVYGYALQVYCDFSGYSDMAIGIALLLGFRLMDNFNSPYKANSIAEFWRRWHISLSRWLLDYLFRPLQMKFRNLRLFGNALAVFLTFVICGLWHGASWLFIFWGFMHGTFMAVSLITQKFRKGFYKKVGLENSKVLKVFQVVITFHLLALSWVFFGAGSFESALDMLKQIFTFFHGPVFFQFVEGYRSIFILLVIGFLLHFTPKSWETKTQELLAKTPVLGQAFILTMVIWLVIQVKSAELQPFIYFQF